MEDRRQQLQRLSVRNGLRPIAGTFGIPNISRLNKNDLISEILLMENSQNVNIVIPQNNNNSWWKWFGDNTKKALNIISDYTPNIVKERTKGIIKIVKDYFAPPPPPPPPPPPQPEPEQESDIEVRETQSALHGRVINIMFRNNRNITDIPTFFTHLTDVVIDNLNRQQKPLRIQFLLNCSYNVIREGEIVEVVYATHRSTNSRIFENTTSINELFNEKRNEIIEQSANFSKWTKWRKWIDFSWNSISYVKY